MARAAARSSFPRWTLGVGLAVAGLLLALFAHTGERAYHLQWFYVALVGLAVCVLGVGYVGWDRAIRPEVERRRARGLPPPPPLKERARALFEEVPAGAAPRAGSGGPAGPDPKAERVRLACPECRHVFAAEGVRPLAVNCPRCGLEGTLP